MGEHEKDPQWYTNKDLYEMIATLKVELATTLRVIREYNGLREQITTQAKRTAAIEDGLSDVQLHISGCQNYAKGKSAVGQAIRDWGGWIVAIVVLAVNILNYLK